MGLSRLLFPLFLVLFLGQAQDFNSRQKHLEFADRLRETLQTANNNGMTDEEVDLYLEDVLKHANDRMALLSLRKKWENKDYGSDTELFDLKRQLELKIHEVADDHTDFLDEVEKRLDREAHRDRLKRRIAEQREYYRNPRNLELFEAEEKELHEYKKMKNKEVSNRRVNRIWESAQTAGLSEQELVDLRKELDDQLASEHEVYENEVHIPIHDDLGIGPRKFTELDHHRLKKQKLRLRDLNRARRAIDDRIKARSGNTEEGGAAATEEAEGHDF